MVLPAPKFTAKIARFWQLTTSEAARIPGLKIILAVPGAEKRRRKDSEKEVVAVLAKPFGLDQLAAVVNRLPVESAVVNGQSR